MACSVLSLGLFGCRFVAILLSGCKCVGKLADIEIQPVESQNLEFATHGQLLPCMTWYAPSRACHARVRPCTIRRSHSPSGPRHTLSGTRRLHVPRTQRSSRAPISYARTAPRPPLRPSSMRCPHGPCTSVVTGSGALARARLLPPSRRVSRRCCCARSPRRAAPPALPTAPAPARRTRVSPTAPLMRAAVPSVCHGKAELSAAALVSSSTASCLAVPRGLAGRRVSGTRALARSPSASPCRVLR